MFAAGMCLSVGLVWSFSLKLPGTPNIHSVYTMKAKNYTETYTYTPWLKDLLAELTTSKLCSVSACRLNYNLNVCIENIVA